MTTQQMLDERYGRTRSPRRRWAIWLAAGVGAVVVGLFAWMTAANAMSSVDVDTTGFEVVDEHSVVLAFQFTAPVGRSVACALEAQDEDHGVVGWRVVELPPSDEHVQAFREEIPTTAAATTGFVNSCWVT